MKISRRDFLKGSATTLFLAGFNLPALALTSKKKNLVVIMLRGGMDGLCAVPIIGDKNFEKKRKSILIENTIKLNSDFALHPKLKGFNDCWNENTGTIVHATSIPYTQRSHFEGQNLINKSGLKLLFATTVPIFINYYGYISGGDLRSNIFIIFVLVLILNLCKTTKRGKTSWRFSGKIPKSSSI